MESFRPVRDKHALDEVSFSVTFKEAISYTEEALATIARVIETLPWKEDINPITAIIMNVNSGVKTESQRPGGFIISSKKDAKVDAPEWKLVVTEDRCAITCRNYIRWSETKEVALNSLFQVVAALNDSIDNLKIGEIHAQYNDIFVYEGANPERQNKEILFLKDSKYLPRFVFETGPLWHQFQGWMSFIASQEFFGNKKLDNDYVSFIHNINLSGSRNEKTSEFLVTAIHLVRCLVGKNSSDFCEKIELDRLLQYSHDENVRLMKDLFTAETLNRIGID